MLINLDGIEEEHRDQVESVLINMVFSVFSEDDNPVYEICIPKDIIEEVDKEYKKENPNFQYTCPAYGYLGGKNIRNSGKSKIILNKSKFISGIDFEDENKQNLASQITLIYHELMHAKYYKEEYEKHKDFIDIESIDKILFEQTRWFIDEYFAVKNTTLYCVEESSVSNVEALFYILDNEYITTNNKLLKYSKENNWQEVLIVAKEYMHELLRYLGMTLGFMDALEHMGMEEICELRNIERQARDTFIGISFTKIHNELKYKEGVLNIDEIFIIGDLIKEIYEKLGIKWKHEEDGLIVCLTKELREL